MNNQSREEKTEKQKLNKQEDKPDKGPVAEFFSKIGYSVWITVMIIGGVIAFVVSLFLL